MTELKFNEEDKQKFVEFLNTVAKHAEFKMNTVEIVAYFKLLSHMQQKILPKIDANILEVKKIIEPKSEEQVVNQAIEDVKKKGKK